ncbi:type IV secretion protein Rhs [Gandjariella thermophila]|uniref:Type IV secretion protein Rhs n=1 Tax=Gandjariella thermophila TaxID=1931992 RepID=A0A4D4J650_9PSEU|nr:type IV secretion protein Rhs [Gandjariella thermophila]
MAQKQDSTTWHTGISLVDDAASVYDGVQSGSWVEAGLGLLGTGLDTLAMVTNPVATLISYGLNWLIEHVKPLQDALNWLAGDPDQISAYAKTWKNVAQAVGKAGQDLTTAIQRETSSWTGQAADAYRNHATNTVNHLSAAATAADTIGTVVEVVGALVGTVRGLVRDMVTQAIGDIIQDALEEVCTLGLGTPVVIAQVVTQVSDWMEKITAVIRKLTGSLEKLRPLMSKLEEIWNGIKKGLSGLRNAEDGADTAARNASHAADDGAHAPHTGGDTTAPSSAGDVPGDTTAPSNAGHTPGDTTTPSSHGGDGTPGHTGTDPGSPGTGDTTAPSHTDNGGPGSSSGHGGSDDTSIKGNNNDPSANSKTESGTPKDGDPVDVSTGVMLQTQTDVQLPGILPLVISRTHKSTYRVGRWFGRSWASTLDQKIEVDDDAVHFAAADGMLLRYPLPAVGAPVLPQEGAAWPLAVGDDGGYTITNRPAGQTLHFAASGAQQRPITAITDRNGNRIDFVYDVHGTLVEVRHSGGYRIGVETTDGLVTELRLIDPETASVVTLMRYRYDDRRCLTEVINSSNLPMRFEYDDAGRMTRWEDRNGMWYRFFYDADGRCVRGEGKDGYLSYTFDYDRKNLVTRSTNSLGHTTTYHLNDRLQVVREIDPLGNTTLSEWDAHHRLLSRTDPLGRTTRYTYDGAGNLTTITRPDGSQAHAEYNEFGSPTVVRQPDGATWRHEYDSRGNLTATTDPAGARTVFERDARGNLTAVIDALGNAHGIEVNAAGLPIMVADPAGAVSRYTRDVLGRVSAVIDPNGNTARIGWNVEGKPVFRTLPDGSTERWVYDGEGNLVEHVDAAGGVTRTEIGHFDLPVAEIGPDGARLAYAYDTELQLVAVTNPYGRVWRYEYDAAGNTIRESDFDGRVISYVRDGAGQLVERINGAGQVTTFSRDEVGNVVEQRSEDMLARFEYDPAGRITRAVNADADVTFRRDVLGRVLAESINGDTVTSTYDLLGRRLVRRTPSGAESLWEYGVGDLPVALHVTGHTVWFSHDAAGHEIERQFDSGFVLSQEWDINHRLASQTLAAVGFGPSHSNQILQHRRYHYRRDGLVAGVDDQLGGPRRFHLDRAGRIIAVHGTYRPERYTYDLDGNITFADWSAAEQGRATTEAQGLREYAGTLLRRAGNVSYRHDRQGRVVRRQQRRLSAKPLTWHYTWNSDDRLVAVTTPDGQRWRYRYDALGRRIAKQRLTEDGSVVEETRFTWDGTVLAEQAEVGTGHGRRTTTWEWEPGRFRPIVQAERSPHQGASQEWFDQKFYAIVTDLVGTPTEMVEPDGNIAWRARHSLWGAPSSHDDGDAHTPLRFPGQYHDPESQLNYNYQRYYDPLSGHYVSNDPLGLAPAPNHHAYVFNPTVWMDPLGLTPYDATTPVGGSNEPRFVSGRDGIIDTADPNLKQQIDNVANHMINNGYTPPPGVRQGGLRGYPPGTWGNRAGDLPTQPLGYYHETDVWPGPGPRGSQRLIVGNGGEVWYTPDHYGTFRRVR